MTVSDLQKQHKVIISKADIRNTFAKVLKRGKDRKGGRGVATWKEGKSERRSTGLCVR